MVGGPRSAQWQGAVAPTSPSLQNYPGNSILMMAVSFLDADNVQLFTTKPKPRKPLHQKKILASRRLPDVYRGKAVHKHSLVKKAPLKTLMVQLPPVGGCKEKSMVLLVYLFQLVHFFVNEHQLCHFCVCMSTKAPFRKARTPACHRATAQEWHCASAPRHKGGWGSAHALPCNSMPYMGGTKHHASSRCTWAKGEVVWSTRSGRSQSLTPELHTACFLCSGSSCHTHTAHTEWYSAV